jgi:hypothetical protein
MGPLTIHNRCLYVKTLEILKDEHKILIPILFYYIHVLSFFHHEPLLFTIHCYQIVHLRFRHLVAPIPMDAESLKW